MNTMREDFEAWAKGKGYRLERDGEPYEFAPTRFAWTAWQAARQPVGEVQPLVYGIRVKGNSAIVGVLPIKLKDFPVTNAEWDKRYEEIPLYADPPQQPERVDGYVLVQIADAKALCAYVTHSPRSALAARRVEALIDNQQESKP